MFGGKGIYFDGVIIAVEIRGEFRLKADAESAPAFEAAGCEQWTYVGSRHGKTVSMPYWSVPDSAFDDPEEMAVWAKKPMRRRCGQGNSRAKVPTLKPPP